MVVNTSPYTSHSTYEDYFWMCHNAAKLLRDAKRMCFLFETVLDSNRLHRDRMRACGLLARRFPKACWIEYMANHTDGGLDERLKRTVELVRVAFDDGSSTVVSPHRVQEVTA